MCKWISESCDEDKHHKCSFLNSFSCNCSCHKHGIADFIEKCAATSAGIASVCIGLITTVGSIGLSALAGGALIGGGVSSTLLAIEKTFNNERMELGEFAAEVSFGAMSGAASNGISAMAEQVIQKTAKQGVQKLAIRTSAGAIAGVVSKGIDEIKQITLEDKKLQDFGQVINEDGYVDVGATLTEWTAGIGIGVVTGASKHFNSIPSKQLDFNSRIMLSTTTCALTDLTSQSANITIGKQKEFDKTKTIKSVAKNAIMETSKKIVISHTY